LEIKIPGKRMKTLLTAETIAARVAEMGAELAEEYAGKEVVMLVVLKGSIIFAADLARATPLDTLALEFMGLSSYGDSTETSGIVRVTLDLARPVRGKHVIIVEDIVDTGLTMRYLLKNLQTREPASLKVCTLLHKPSRQTVEVPLDYVGFEIENHFVVGYGLDFEQKYRNVPFIGYMVDA
jgi:hypoxanthine phosphoribosyltransferase